MIAALSLLPWWIGLPLLVGSWILALIVAIAAYGALSIIAVRAWHSAWHLVDLMTALFVNLTISAFAGCLALLRTLASLLLWPVTILFEYTAVRAHNAFALKAEAYRQRRQLWHHWQREFRHDFPTFQEFLDAFEGRKTHREEPRFQDEPRPEGREQGRRAQDPPRPPPDLQRATFIAACRLLGLPESGFNLEQLNARYRALMSKSHPDRGGNHQRAAAINAARALIKRTKGWS